MTQDRDQLGDVVSATSGTGTRKEIYTYGPFGEPNVTTGMRFRYTGQWLIGELGLYYYKARFYSPDLGRFLQTDPIGYKDDLNPYAYVKNNPINYTDPSGLSGVDSKWSGARMDAAFASQVAYQSDTLWLSFSHIRATLIQKTMSDCPKVWQAG
ncbi:RHS repeat-associated core domain-containing protein [Lysobacter arvi]|uniref:RHS repeat-associated core domain-containing protein n=1 Tax=Lysobacter arvi TaxID=3038776 RepID=A0ABU1CF53_9GAMM|nr:RHS repeat-associated core domain-containing protein [Lysobacter arvi]MDR0183573.1 RHS repeat-associated core domain-containing protein [Lysobacter arvi]